MKNKMRKRNGQSTARRRMTKIHQRKVNGRYRLYFRTVLSVHDQTEQ